MKLETVKKYLEEKINNSWYSNAKLDYGISGHFIDAQEEGNHLRIIWEEQGNRYHMVINWYQEYTLEQLYNIWMEGEGKEEENGGGERLIDVLLDYGERFYKAEQLRTCVYNGQLVITDISDALKPGKSCKEWAFYIHSWENPDNLAPVEFVEMATGCDTLQELAAFLRAGESFLEVRGLNIATREMKAIRTYSPFAVIKPIKAPEKWTIAHVWKAILSGQISAGSVSGIYTDDYAFDAAYNFQAGDMGREGLLQLAQKLIDSPRGWSVYEAKTQENGSVVLKIACHTFDFRELVFCPNAQDVEKEEGVKPYYKIDEELCRRAHEQNHMLSDYKMGSTTASYRAAVDQFAAKCEEAKRDCLPGREDKLNALADRYAKRLAKYYNDMAANDARHVAWFVSGRSKYNMHAHDKWSRRNEALLQEWQEIQEMENAIHSQAGNSGIIRAGEPNAEERLQAKLDQLCAEQEAMKAVNAWYRKHKTLDGCPELTPKEADAIKTSWASGWYVGKPYPPYALQNNNANIKRTRERLESLRKVKEKGSAKATIMPGVKCVENTGAMRIQLFFESKPSTETRTLLKGKGFRWAPSVGAWQRQLTDNGRRAAKEVIEHIKN